jgi:hypothetical protein
MGPMAVTYAMRTKQKSWQAKLPNSKRTQPVKNSTDGGGTFLTGMDTGGGDDPAFEARVQKSKRVHGASAGQNGLRSRIQTKKVRAREIELGQKKHDTALKELNRRRNEQQIQKRPRRGVKGVAKGISSGVRTKNRHMADFQKQKTDFRSKKDNIAARGVAGGGARAARAARESNNRFGSRTAPVRGGNSSRRVPNVKSAGNMTRRAKEPSRNRTGGGRGGEKDNAAAVGGIGGIRMLRGSGKK